MRRSSSSDRIRGSFKKYFTFCSNSTDFIKISLQWSWLKNQFVLTILVVNRTSCGERGVLQTEVLKVPELPDGTQVSLQWWIFVRAGRPVARCIQSWLSIAGSLSRPDRYLTTQIQARGGSWGQHFLMIIFWWRRTFSRPAETIHKQLVTDGGEWIIKPTVDLILITRSDFRNKGKSSDYDKIKLLSTFLFMFSFHIPDSTMALSPGHSIEVGPLFLVLGHKISTVDASHICWVK